MAQKSPGPRADKRAAKTIQRAMGKPVRQRTEQTRAKPEKVEASEQDLSRNRSCYGRTVGKTMKCPHCGKKINVGALLRSKRPTAAQKEAAKLNGKKGGRPKKTNDDDTGTGTK